MVQDEHWSHLKDFVPLKAAKSGTAAPDVLFSTKPAEVILFEGKPVYACDSRDAVLVRHEHGQSSSSGMPRPIRSTS